MIGPLEPSFEEIGQRETFHREHDLIEQNLALVQKVKQAKMARQLLLATVLMCRSHFDKEERIVFPMAERVLKAKTSVRAWQSMVETPPGGSRSKSLSTLTPALSHPSAYAVLRRDFDERGRIIARWNLNLAGSAFPSSTSDCLNKEWSVGQSLRLRGVPNAFGATPAASRDYSK